MIWNVTCLQSKHKIDMTDIVANASTCIVYAGFLSYYCVCILHVLNILPFNQMTSSTKLLFVLS